MTDLLHRFLDGVRQTGAPEFIAVIAGIVSVWFSRKENILVYPTGLINTIIYIYLSVQGNLYGEASVNLYYTVMSIYGWVLWSKKDEQKKTLLLVTYSTSKEWVWQLVFFSFFYALLFLLLYYLKYKHYAPGAMPAADAFASASAYTGMWLMARKKVESWYWWIATNTASIPLYFAKGYVFTSFQFIVLLVMAVAGLQTWKQKATHAAH